MSNNAQLEAIPAEGLGTGGEADAHSPEIIEAWLIDKVADLLGIEPGEIDAEKELTTYGLSSVTGVMLAGDIEDWLGVQLEPTVAWEYPSVREMAHFLAGEARRGREVGA